MMEARGHRQLEHTADLCIEAWGPSEAAMLAEAARALVAWISEEAAPARTCAQIEMTGRPTCRPCEPGTFDMVNTWSHDRFLGW